MSEQVRYGDKQFEISSRDKLFFPEVDVTKGDLIDYYRDVAETMLAHMRQRPLTLQRYPDGITQEGFIQQKRSDYFPDWIGQVKTPRASDRRKSVIHPVCNDEASLVYLANQAVITFHGWLACTEDIERPDKLVFDLDPPGSDFAPVRQAARRVGRMMEALGMTPFVMTTGSRGLHVVAPLKPQRKFDDVRDYASAMAQQLARCYPDELTVEQRKDKRRGRIYLDVMRNAYGQTAVLPYTIRDKAIAPIATPITWDELNDSSLGAQKYHIKNIRRRLGQRDDPWKDFKRHAVDPQGLQPPEEVSLD